MLGFLIVSPHGTDVHNHHIPLSYVSEEKEKDGLGLSFLFCFFFFSNWITQFWLTAYGKGVF